MKNKKEKKILIITDDNDYLCLSLLTNRKNNSVHIEIIAQCLERVGWRVEQCRYSDINEDYEFRDGYVLYASSEDYGLFYKDYIEDILLILQKKNNILLPEFDFFRAHHNKVYMELLRKQFKEKSLKNIESWVFASYSDLKRFMNAHKMNYPLIIKSAAGSGSSGVGIANTNKELLGLGKKYSNRIYFDNYANFYRTKFFQKIKNLVRRVHGYKEVTYRKKEGKFIVQNFIPNLKYDYKVLIFGKKYYVLQRRNRKNDFRASGSGKFSFPDISSETKQILDYAKCVKKEIRQPMLSLDIGYDGKVCYLIEFQCVSFGPYTLQMSNKYFVDENNWKVIREKSFLEEEIAQAIHTYYEEI